MSGPFWLPRQMLAVAPTYGLLAKGVVKALRRVFCAELRLGRIVGQGSGELRIGEAGHYRIWPGHPRSGRGRHGVPREASPAFRHRPPTWTVRYSSEPNFIHCPVHTLCFPGVTRAFR